MDYKKSYYSDNYYSPEALTQPSSVKVKLVEEGYLKGWVETKVNQPLTKNTELWHDKNYVKFYLAHPLPDKMKKGWH